MDRPPSSARSTSSSDSSKLISSTLLSTQRSTMRQRISGRPASTAIGVSISPLLVILTASKTSSRIRNKIHAPGSRFVISTGLRISTSTLPKSFILNPSAPMTTLTLKLDTLYAACSPELGVLSFGGCRDEALNNLTDEIRLRHKETESTTGDGKQSHV